MEDQGPDEASGQAEEEVREQAVADPAARPARQPGRHARSAGAPTSRSAAIATACPGPWPGSQGDSYRLREKKKAGLLGRKPKPVANLEEEEHEEEVGAHA